MMYINQNSFPLNELIMPSSGTFNLIQQNTATTTNFASQQKSASLYQATTLPTASNTSSIATSTTNSNLQHSGRSTSVSSTGSTSSTSSSSSTTTSTPSTSPASSNQFNKLTQNPIYPLNYAYYNPTALASNFNTSSTNQSKPFVGNSVYSTPPLTNTVLTTPTNLSATSATFNNLNEKFMYRPKSDNGILSNLNSYQLNVLTQKNPNQYHFNTTQTPASIVNSDSNLSTSTNLFLFNTTKNAQQNNQNYYNYAEPTITYLPTSTDLFFTTSPSVDQFSTSYLTTPYLATTAPITQSNLSTKSLLPTFSTKAPFTATSVGINIKKKKRRFKKPIELRKVLPKNSLMLLHEYRPNVEYRFICQSGPIHRPIFTMCVEINEHKFEGEGKTKKEARMAAAEKAIEFLMKNPEYIQKSNHSTTSANLSSQSLNTKLDKEENATNNSKSTELSDDDDNEDDDADHHQVEDEDDENEGDSSDKNNVKRFKTDSCNEIIKDEVTE